MTAAHPGETAVTLARITRYPVKGLPGSTTSSALVTPGQGLAFDRVVAIETGDAAHEGDGAWRPRAVFHHLAKNPSLVLFRTALDPDVDGPSDRPDGDPGIDAPGAAVRLTVTGPGGASASIRLAGPEPEPGPGPDPGPDLGPLDAAVREWFPPGAVGDPAVVAPGVRLWDWPHALISLINLETVAALEAHTGRPVDARRFRGNLLVAGLPAWSEFGLVGRVVAIGDAEFEVFQPTDRCRATTVDPATGLVDLNVPAQLAARFGHMFCGVYLRPRAAGRIAVGDGVRVLPRPGPAREPADDATTEALAEWLRPATVSRRRSETAAVESFWLDDSAGLLAGARPGQHVRLHLPAEPSPNWRNYTVSAVDGGAVRITVKRDGTISSLLHDTIDAGADLLVSGPFGPVQFDPADAHPLVLVTAGIGITPAVAILRALVAAGSQVPVGILHVDRTLADIPLHDELVALVAALPRAHLTLHFTGIPAVSRTDGGGGAGAWPGERIEVRTGRPTPGDVAAAVARVGSGAGASDPAHRASSAGSEVRAYLCGPGGFLHEMRRALEGCGIAPARIHFDVFYTPVLPDDEPEEPPLAGPFAVDLGDGGPPATWRPSAGSLLDLAEANGLDWPSACRSGACGTCENSLRSGTIAYLSRPVVTPPDGRILTCCAVPTSDVVVGG